MTADTGSVAAGARSLAGTKSGEQTAPEEGTSTTERTCFEDAIISEEWIGLEIREIKLRMKNKIKKFDEVKLSNCKNKLKSLLYNKLGSLYTNSGLAEY